MKNNWQTKTLGEVCEIGAGNSAPQKKEMFEEGEYPFFRTSDVGKIHLGIIYDSADMLNKRGIEKLKLFPKGTLLFPKSGASTFLNHRVLLGVDGYVSSHLATIKAKEKFLLDSFLYYYSRIIDSRNLMQDQNYPSLRLSDIEKIEISYPNSLETQKAIVKILDEVFESISKSKENAEKNLKNAKELFESYLEEIFSNPKEDWEEKKLGEVCIIKGRIGYRGYTKQDLVKEGEGAISLSPSNIKNNELNFEKCTYISWEKYNESPEIMLKKGDIVYCKTASIGKMGLIDFLPEKATLNPQFVVLKEISCLNEFLFYSMNTKSFKAQIKNIIGGTAVPTLSQTNLAEIKLFIPKSLEEQKTIVQKLDLLSKEIKELESIYEQKVKDLEELKKSMLQKAFSGELTKE